MRPQEVWLPNRGGTIRLSDPPQFKVEIELPDYVTPDEMIDAIRAAAVGLTDCRVEAVIPQWAEHAATQLVGWRNATDEEIARLQAWNAKLEEGRRAQYEKLRSEYEGK